MTDPNDPLTRALARLPAPEPSAALRRAVAEIPLRHPQTAPGSFALPFRPLWAWLAAGTLMVALGALSGALASDIDLSPVLAQPAPSEDAAEDELSELTELAFAAELDEELAP